MHESGPVGRDHNHAPAYLLAGGGGPDNVGRSLCPAGRTPGVQVLGRCPAGRKRALLSIVLFSPFKNVRSVYTARYAQLCSYCVYDVSPVLGICALPLGPGGRVTQSLEPLRAEGTRDASQSCRSHVPSALLSAPSFDWHWYHF